MPDRGYHLIMLLRTARLQTIIETLPNLITTSDTQDSIRLKALLFAIVNKLNRYIECKIVANLVYTSCFQAGKEKEIRRRNFRKNCILYNMRIRGLSQGFSWWRIKLATFKHKEKGLMRRLRLLKEISKRKSTFWII